jgi:hypothetical protein
MKLETTCRVCGDTVRGERSFYSGGFFDTFEKHECETLNLTTARHVEYKPVPQPSHEEGNNAVD